MQVLASLARRARICVARKSLGVSALTRPLAGGYSLHPLKVRQGDRMRASVMRFVAAATRSLNLEGPVAWLAGPCSAADSGQWASQLLAGKVIVRCTLPIGASGEFDVPVLPLAAESVGTMICLDLVQRFDETAAVLDLAHERLASGGLLILSADVTKAQPEAERSRVLTPIGLERLVAHWDAALVGWHGSGDFPQSLFLIACRAPAPIDFSAGAGELMECFQRDMPQCAERGWLDRFIAACRHWLREDTDTDPPVADSVSFALHLPRPVNWRSAMVGRRTAPGGSSQTNHY